MLEDPWFDPSATSNKDMFVLSVDPEDAPNEAEYIELEFEQGNCVAVNGQRLAPPQIMETLERAGRQARGRPRRYGGEPFRRHEEPRRI